MTKQNNVIIKKKPVQIIKFNRSKEVTHRLSKIPKINFALATFKRYQKETLNLIKNDRLKLIYMDKSLKT